MEDPTALSTDQQWDGLPTVNNPTLPFIGKIPGGMRPGKTMHVKGVVEKCATKFNINLQCGENSLPYADAALHFSANFDDSVVCNTRVGGEWGDEEVKADHPTTPFVRGEPFDMVIHCEEDKYKIYINGKHYTDYKHRLPLENVDHISFKFDVEVKAVRFGKGNADEFIKTKGRSTVENNSVENNHTDNSKTPFSQPIKDRLQEGSLIYISGFIPQYASVFSVNLQQDGECVPGMNCALHIKPVFQSQLVCSSVVDKTWGMQETMDAFPFQNGRRFYLKMQCQTTGYKVWVDKKTILDYDHRISDLDRINCISLDGQIQVNSISYTQEDEDEEDDTSSIENEVAAEKSTPENMEQESVSVNSIEEESNDSTKQSVDNKEEEMESISEEASVSPATIDSATKDSITESSVDQDNVEQKTVQKPSDKIDTDKNGEKGQGDDVKEGPDRKKRKIDQERKMDNEEEDEDAVESGAESDDSEKKDGDFEVERILTRRKGPDGDEYLLKWGGWSLYDCTWEPEANVSKGVKRAFGKPIITTDRLVNSCDVFVESIQSHLSGSRSSEQIKLRIEHDILRGVLGDGGRPADKADPMGWKWYNKSDLQAWNLPDSWWYRLDKKGNGKQVSFPVKMKIQLDWTPLSYVVDKHRKLIPAKRKPLELLLIQMKKRDYKL